MNGYPSPDSFANMPGGMMPPNMQGQPGQAGPMTPQTPQTGGKKKSARSSGKKVVRKDSRTKAELYECAKKKDIEGRSAMNKAQLKRALAK